MRIPTKVLPPPSIQRLTAVVSTLSRNVYALHVRLERLTAEVRKNSAARGARQLQLFTGKDRNNA